MINIGVLRGEAGNDIYDIINKLLINKDNEYNINIELISSNIEPNKYSILIINKTNINFNLEKSLIKQGIIIINIDEKLSCPIKLINPVRVITTGFNPKACVTASSVICGEYNTIQLCIQRTLPTIQGEVLEPQEFSVNTQKRNVQNVIYAITTLIISGYSIKELSCNSF